MTTTFQATSGTQLYVLNNLVSPHVVVAVPQLKGLSPVGGGARKKIDASNFDSQAYDEISGGRAAPPEMSGELVLDLGNTGHQTLKKLFEASAAGTIGNIQFYIGESDAAGAPTVVAGSLQPPVTASPKHYVRSGHQGNGYIANLQAKAADNDIWRADFKFQATGKTTWTHKGDTLATTY